jgi:signal transduction histidine kinase
MESLSKEEISQRKNILKSIHLFRELDELMLNEVAQILIKKTLDAGQTLFEKDDVDYALYLIVDGKVKIHVANHTYAFFEKNQYFGEYSLLDSSPRSASVTAVEPSILLKFEQNAFLNLIEKYPEIAKIMITGLVKRLRGYNYLEAELTRKNSEIKKQNLELEKQQRELQALNATKDKFFAIISHDLKNPFSTVLGISELLAREFESIDAESLKTFIHQIYKYSNNTYNLLENLLQWSMVQTGRMPMRPKIVNIMNIVQENVDLLLGNAQQKKIDVSTQSCKDCFTYVDVNQITTVVRNLLTNAIKFTPPDGKIGVQISSSDQFWIVSITDNGIGIAEKDLKRLFLLDSNPSTIGTSQEKGTGLGLILCKEFVERNGGKIWVESQVGVGTTFHFSLPKCDTDKED